MWVVLVVVDAILPERYIPGGEDWLWWELKERERLAVDMTGRQVMCYLVHSYGVGGRYRYSRRKGNVCYEA